MEERIQNLEQAQRADRAQLLALHCVVRALIAAHPNRPAVKALFQRVTANYVQHMRDIGFEDGHGPDVPKYFVEPFEEAVQDWLGHLDK